MPSRSMGPLFISILRYIRLKSMDLDILDFALLQYRAFNGAFCDYSYLFVYIPFEM